MKRSLFWALLFVLSVSLAITLTAQTKTQAANSSPVSESNEGGMVYVKGSVWLNGSGIPGSSAILPGDILQTNGDAAALLSTTSRRLTIAPDSTLKFENINLIDLRRGAMAVQEYKVKLVVHTDIVSIAPANDVDCTLFEVREAEDEVRILAGDGKLNVTDSHGTITVLPGEETVYGREGKKKGTPAPGNNPILDSPWAKVGGTAAAAGFLGFLAAHPEPKSISPFTP